MHVTNWLVVFVSSSGNWTVRWRHRDVTTSTYWHLITCLLLTRWRDARWSNDTLLGLATRRRPVMTTSARQAALPAQLPPCRQSSVAAAIAFQKPAGSWLASSRARRQRSTHPVDPECRRLLTRLVPSRRSVGNTVNKATCTVVSPNEGLKTVPHWQVSRRQISMIYS